MKALPLIIIALFLTPTVFAYDLFEYPVPFAIENTKMNAILVVGDKAPATHVIAQTNIALSLTAYAGDTATGKTKLASELSSYDDHIISIGNACANAISAEILGNPSPCYDGYEAGQASIRSFEREINGDKYIHLVVAGYTDKGTQAAADHLKNFQTKNLKGTELVIDVDDAADAPVPEDLTLEAEPVPVAVQEEEEEDKEELLQEKQEPTQPSEPVVVEEPVEEEQAAPPAVERIPEEKKGFIAKIFSWFANLFK